MSNSSTPTTDPSPAKKDPTAQATVQEGNDQSTVAVAPAPRNSMALRKQVIRHVLSSAGIMILLYGLAYYPWGPESFAGKQLRGYLELVAAVSAATLRLLGEFVATNGPTVTGRFSYVIVVDCAALDVQALFAAAVLAFPSKWSTRLIGLAVGVVAIFAINIVRLVALYFVGVHSTHLFKLLHEEVFVFVIVALVCGVFLLWARWATAQTRLRVASVPVAA
jgi:exosortase/archaeosortase family protein